jgi:hypothetical protein
MKDDSDENAQALPELDAAEEAALAEALRASVRPGELTHERHQALLEAALLDPLAEPTEHERAAAAELRAALERNAPHTDAELARALAAAFRPLPAGHAAAAATERAVSRALPRPKVIAIAFAATAALSLAAGFLLFVGAHGESTGTRPELAESRSLSPLFARQPIESESERLDRIVLVRSRELRDNRFASWGVQ